MSMTIYKYPLRVDDQQAITLPAGSRVLTVQAQNEAPCIWALVNPELDALERHDFRTLGTGHPFPDAAEWPTYLGTYQLRGGDLVFHVFTRVVRP